MTGILGGGTTQTTTQIAHVLFGSLNLLQVYIPICWSVHCKSAYLNFASTLKSAKALHQQKLHLLFVSLLNNGPPKKYSHRSQTKQVLGFNYCIFFGLGIQLQICQKPIPVTVKLYSGGNSCHPKPQPPP